MTTAPVRSTLFRHTLIIVLTCCLHFAFFGPTAAAADDEPELVHCIIDTVHSARRPRAVGPSIQAASERMFLPFISLPPDSSQPAPDADRLSQTPRIDRYVESDGDGTTCVTIELTNNTGRALSRLTIEHLLFIGAGTVSQLTALGETDAPFAAEAIVGASTASCRFTTIGRGTFGPGQRTAMSCQYREDAVSVVTSTTNIIPTPLPVYDDNFDQIDDGLAEFTVSLDEDTLVPLLILLDRQPNEQDLDAFRGAGGEVTFVPQQLTLFGGELPLSSLTQLADDLRDHLVVIGHDDLVDRAPFLDGLISDGTSVATLPQIDQANGGDDSQKIAIGILDTGLDITHKGLQGRVSAWYDVLDPENQTPIDTSGHGSYVAGIVAGETDEFRGVTTATPLVGIRHGEAGQWRVQNYLRAIDWAISNRRALDITILNNSNVYTEDTLRQNPFWGAAARQAVESGIVFVNAAGDGFGASMDGELIGSPATEPKVLSVGSVTPNNHLSFFSSQGDSDAVEPARKKPDVVAPGGNVRSILAGQSGTNALVVQSGTSAAAPFVAGEAALLVAQLFDAANADDDADNRSGEDGWDGIDNDGDDLIDEDPQPWPFSERSVMTVKSLILMAAAEVDGGEAVPQEWINAGAVNDPKLRDDVVLNGGWDRGQKDHVEGHGSVDIGAALDAVTEPFCGYDGGSFGSLPTESRVWARHLHLYAGKEYRVVLDGPEDADYDLYLYQHVVGPYGEPHIAKRPGFDGAPIASTAAGRADESITFEVRTDGLYYLVVRRVQGTGPFDLHLTTQSAWTLMFYVAAEQAGEKNLDDQAFALLNSLEEVGAAQGTMRDVQIIALIDYDARDWQDDSPRNATVDSAGDALLYCVRKDHRPLVNQYSVAVQNAEFLSTTVDSHGTAHAEVNMGASQTLSDFAGFAIDHFPASRYGLFIWGDDNGFGWKGNPELALGLGSDTRQIPGDALDSNADALEMAELSDALSQIGEKIGRGSDYTVSGAGSGRLDILGLDMGQMAQIEVAAQVEPWVDVLVAPQTNLMSALPYASMLEALKCRSVNNVWDCSAAAETRGADLARLLVERFEANGGQDDTPQVLSAISLNGSDVEDETCSTFRSLLNCVDSLADSLVFGIERRVASLDNSLNNQVLLKEQVRDQVVELDDRNQIDLAHFAQLLSNSDLESRYRPLAESINAQLNKDGSVVLALGKRGEAEQLHGLSIYFPAEQWISGDGCRVATTGSFECGYDNPLPSPWLYAADPEIRLLGNGGLVHPRPALQGLRFVEELGWDSFLRRYYKPVSQACLVQDGICHRQLTAQIGDEIILDGNSSSDIDGPTTDNSVNAWYWDLDVTADSSAGLPNYPNDLDTPCTEDCDRDGLDGPDDDPDATGATQTWQCEEPGMHVLRLIVHDDHHQQAAMEGESDQERHWNVDRDTVIISCFESPFQSISPDPIVSTRAYSYVLSVRGNRALTSPAMGSIQITMSPLASIDLASMSCPNNGCEVDPAQGMVTWSGEMVNDGEVRIAFEATVDTEMLLNAERMPALLTQTKIFDGYAEETLEARTPVIVKHVTPSMVSPGSTMTYTTLIPATDGLVSGGNAEMFDSFDDDALYPYLALTDELTYPEQSQPPVGAFYSGLVSWSGAIEPDDTVFVRYQVKLDNDLPTEFCGKNITTTGQVLDGQVTSGRINTSVSIACPNP